MKILVDMNLSPRWVDFLAESGMEMPWTICPSLRAYSAEGFKFKYTEPAVTA